MGQQAGGLYSRDGKLTPFNPVTQAFFNMSKASGNITVNGKPVKFMERYKDLGGGYYQERNMGGEVRNTKVADAPTEVRTNIPGPSSARAKSAGASALSLRQNARGKGGRTGIGIGG